MRLKYHVFRYLFLAIAVFFFAWCILESDRATSRTLVRLVEAGWELYLGRGDIAPAVFLSLCLDEACGAFVKVWLQEYPLILSLSAIVFVWAGAVFSVLAHKKVNEKS